MRCSNVLIFIALTLFGQISIADVDNVDIGGEIMFEYFWGNEFDLRPDFNDEINFFRPELDLWLQVDLEDNIMFRIALEGDRKLNSMEFGNYNQLLNNDYNFELFAEEAYIKASDILSSGFFVSIGRQFLNYGDDVNSDDFNRWWGPGLIIADSNAYDPLLLSQLGEHEIDPFDAIVVSYQTEYTSFDLLHAGDLGDNFISPNKVIDNDATLSALYASYFGIENHQFDLYAALSDQDGAPGTIGFDAEKWIIGGRSAGDISEEIAYKAELAYQFEDNNKNVNLEADAFNLQAGINYHPNLNLRPNFGLLYTFLQQDGLDHSMSGFSSPFKGKVYGELFEGLTRFMDRGGNVNPFTNMHVLNFSGGFEPVNDIALSLDLYFFFLDEEIDALTSTSDEDAGFEIDSQIDYQFNDNLRTFFGGGVFIPGDAVEEIFMDDDEAYFFRAGFKVSF